MQKALAWKAFRIDATRERTRNGHGDWDDGRGMLISDEDGAVVTPGKKRALEISVNEVWARLRARWRLILAMTILGTFLGVLASQFMEPVYVARTVVTATDPQAGRSDLASAIGGLGRFSIGEPPTADVTPFARFLEIMVSVELAEQLLRENPQLRSIIAEKPGSDSPPETVSIPAFHPDYWNHLFYGREPEREIDPFVVREFLDNRLTITMGDYFATISFEHRDRDLALSLLQQLVSMADRIAREQRRALLRARIVALTGAIAREDNIDAKRLMVNTLSQQKIEFDSLSQIDGYSYSSADRPKISESPQLPPAIPIILFLTTIGFTISVYIALSSPSRRNPG